MARNNEKSATPPHSTVSEKSVLGSMLLDEYVQMTAFDMLTEGMFYHAAHKLLYQAMVDTFDMQKPVDTTTVVSLLTFRKQLEDAGGPGYISDLVTDVPTTANFEAYAKTVVDMWKLRKHIGVGRKMIENCMSGESDPEDIIEENERMVYEASQGRARNSFEPVTEVMKHTVATLERLKDMGKGGVTGVDTGFTKLNEMTTGFHRGELILVAARPAMGKTAFALNMAEHISSGTGGVALFSLEMTSEQLVMRLLAAHARIPGQRLRTGTLSTPHWAALGQAMQHFKKCKIYIDGSASLTPTEMRSRCRRLKAEHPDLACVFVDYIQLMDGGKGMRSRQEEVSYISRSLKQMAMELDLPVVALSQLNRESEKVGGQGHRPQLSQLRESGSLEQDADVVLLLYRPSYFSNEDDERAEVILAKQRNGPTGTVPLRFLDKFARFEDGVEEEGVE